MTGGGEIGSDAMSSAQLNDVGGDEVIRVGSGVGPECGVVCEPASCILREVV